MSAASERAQVVRFLLLGTANTIATYAAYVLLARVLDDRLAYALVFAAGVVFAVTVTGGFVFRAQTRGRHLVRYAAWYLLVLLVGLTVLELARRAGLGQPELNGLAVLAVTAPLSYLGGRLVFRSAAPSRSSSEATL